MWSGTKFRSVWTFYNGHNLKYGTRLKKYIYVYAYFAF